MLCVVTVNSCLSFGLRWCDVTINSDVKIRSDQTIYFPLLVCFTMAHFGNLEEFDCSRTDIDSYFERLHSFFRANNVRDASKVDVLLSVIGSKTYKLLKSLLSPALPSTKTVDEQYTYYTEKTCSTH